MCSWHCRVSFQGDLLHNDDTEALHYDYDTPDKDQKPQTSALILVLNGISPLLVYCFFKSLQNAAVYTK